MSKEDRPAGLREPEAREPSPTEVRYPPQVCEVCETVMYGLHCKIVCPNCGYKRDCSDP